MELENQYLPAAQTDHLQRRSHKENTHEIMITDESGSRKGRKMHRVLPQLTQLKKQQQQQQQHIDHVHDPVLVSLGPYHHGRPGLERAQAFKHLCLDWFASSSEQKKTLYFNEIKENIEEIRNSYAETWILERYSDEELARMMLLDGCIIINYMASRTQNQAMGSGDGVVLDWDGHLGLASAPFMVRDLVKIENQVPFKVIKLLLSLREGELEWDELLHRFLRWMLLKDGSQERISVRGEYDNEDPPLHILEAIWRAITRNYEASEDEKMWDWARLLTSRRKRQDKKLPHCSHPQLFGSVTDLKAKGIRFSPSSHSLKAIAFKSCLLHGCLELPIRFVSDQHQVILANLIGYELSPDSRSACTVLSYAAFMKELIEGPEDVKELQDRGILFNKYSNHEQVVESFREIDTFGLAHSDIFDDVREKIGEHCRSRPKMWIANLVRTYFYSPWRVVSLLAAAFLFVFAFLQTVFTIRGGWTK